MSENIKEIKQTTEEQREIRNRVLSLLVLKESFERKQKEYEDAKSDVNHVLKTFLEKRGTNKGLILTDDEKISLAVVEPTKIEWDIDKLCKRLDKEIAEDVIQKQITITNYKAIVDLLKKYKVPAQEFKQYLDVNRTVNEQALNDMFDLGRLDKKQIKGCYTINKNKAHVRITKSEKKE